MYSILSELLSDKKGGATFTCFGSWHLLYIALIFGGILLALVWLSNKSESMKQRAIRRVIHCAFALYILDFFLMPFAYGEIDLEKLPFHICTATCVLCFLSRHNQFFEKFKLQFALLGLIGNLIYVIYPAGVGQFQIHPLSYRVLQTLSFHGLMTAYGVFVLAFDDVKLEWKKSYKELLVIIAMTLWALLGNTLYNGSVGEYSHNFNWFFVTQDPFYILPENIAPYIMPFIMIAVIFIADMLVYVAYFGIKKLVDLYNARRKKRMKVIEQKWELNDGHQIPAIGVGFWQIKKEDAKRVVLESLEVGYRHIDTAIAYENETEIGEALKETEIPREELFITSKIPAEVKSYEGAKKAIDESLVRLGLEYLDLMLIHAPKPWAIMHIPFTKRYKKENAEVYRAMLEAQKEGKIKSLGVSNFKKKDILNLIKRLKVTPSVNQIRTHIGHVDVKTIEFCKEHNILVEAYSPIMTGRLKKNKKIQKMAGRYAVSVPQLCIRFDHQIGVLPLPKTTHKEYLEQNKEVDFKISDEDMQKLLKIKTF